MEYFSIRKIKEELITVHLLKIWHKKLTINMLESHPSLRGKYSTFQLCLYSLPIIAYTTVHVCVTTFIEITGC